MIRYRIYDTMYIISYKFQLFFFFFQEIFLLLFSLYSPKYIQYSHSNPESQVPKNKSIQKKKKKKKKNKITETTADMGWFWADSQPTAERVASKPLSSAGVSPPVSIHIHT